MIMQIFHNSNNHLRTFLDMMKTFTTLKKNKISLYLFKFYLIRTIKDNTFLKNNRMWSTLDIIIYAIKINLLLLLL